MRPILAGGWMHSHGRRWNTSNTYFSGGVLAKAPMDAGLDTWNTSHTGYPKPPAHFSAGFGSERQQLSAISQHVEVMLQLPLAIEVACGKGRSSSAQADHVGRSGLAAGPCL